MKHMCTWIKISRCIRVVRRGFKIHRYYEWRM